MPDVLDETYHVNGGPDPRIYMERGSNVPFGSQPEYVRELTPGVMAYRTYERMINNDAQVEAVVTACATPILGAEWVVKPPDTDNPEDADIAEMVHYNLFSGMSQGWNEFLEEAIQMLTYGFATFEQVYYDVDWSPAAKNRRTRPFVFLRKLAPRPALTVEKFNYDSHGGPESIDHIKYDPNMQTIEQQRLTIPIEDLLVLTFHKRGGDMRGRSILRSAYKHWYYKDNFYKIDGVQKERHGIGIPFCKLPPGFSQEDLDLAAEMCKNVRTNEKAYMLIPPGWEFGFAKVEGQQVDCLTSAREHDVQIARSVLVQFISGGTGGRSEVVPMLDLFLKSTRRTANIIVDGINKHIIPKLVKYNYPDVPTSRYPKLTVTKIGENKEFQQFAAGLRNLVDVGALTVDHETEEWIRDQLEMPRITDANRIKEQKRLEKANQSSTPFGQSMTKPPTGREGKLDPGGAQ